LKKFVGIAIAAAMLSVAIPAYAHKPLDGATDNYDFSTALKIPDPQVSWVAYQELERGHPKYYTFDASKDDRLYAQITIPQLEGLENFAPSLALVGDGVENNASVPFHAPQGMGAMVVDYKAPAPETFYEPFTQTLYWERQELVIDDLPSTGTYYLVVFDESGAAGKYGLAVGEREDFSIVDFFTVLPAAWFETKFFFGDYATPGLVVALLAAVPILTVIALKRRKTGRFS
jgi:hypothetical protein